MDASLEEQSTGVCGLMGRKDIVSSLHYLPLTRVPSHSCPVAFLQLIKEGQDKIQVSLRGAWHVCRQLSHGKALGIIGCELADRGRRMLTYTLCGPLQSAMLCVQAPARWGFDHFL